MRNFRGWSDVWPVGDNRSEWRMKGTPVRGLGIEEERQTRNSHGPHEGGVPRRAQQERRTFQEGDVLVRRVRERRTSRTPGTRERVLRYKSIVGYRYEGSKTCSK